MLPSFLEDHDAGGDAGAKEDVGGQADDGVEDVFRLDQMLADVLLGRTAEQNAVGKDRGHRAAVGDLVEHVLHEGKVGLGLGGELAVVGKAVVAQKQVARVPLGAEGRIGHDGIEALIEVLWTLERVLVFDVKLLVSAPRA